jgi:hypothetical protein
MFDELGDEDVYSMMIPSNLDQIESIDPKKPPLRNVFDEYYPNENLYSFN